MNKIMIVGAVAVVSLVAVGCFSFVPSHSRSDPMQKDMVVTAAMRSELIDSAIASLDQHYVYPDKAAALGRQLREQLKHGDFDSITSADQLADRLTDAMQDVLHDKHLEMRYFEKPIPEALPNQPELAEDEAKELLEERRLDYGMATVSRLHGNIGYIDLHQFGRPQQAASRIDAAMTMLADTQALIIDLRRNHGGDPETVMLLASYLFDEPTHLNDIWWRDTGVTEQRWTSKQVRAPRYGKSRPVYVLTSADTFSAGEDFAYALKYAGRATIVGEVTGGGAHAGDRHRLGAHFMMNVPSGRTINPVTHTDWEGVGVQPDVPVSAKKALDAAQIAVLKQLIAKEADPDWRQRLTETLDELT